MKITWEFVQASHLLKSLRFALLGRPKFATWICPCQHPAVEIVIVVTSSRQTVFEALFPVQTPGYPGRGMIPAALCLKCEKVYRREECTHTSAIKGTDRGFPVVSSRG